MRARQIVITGFHRSCTSMTMQALKQAGLYVGDELMAAAPSNADGHFEDIETVELHEQWLRDAQSNWCHVGKPPVVNPELASAEINRIAQRLGCVGKTWGIKDPRASLFLDNWFETLEAPVGVFLYRHFASCYESLQRRHAADLLSNPTTINDSFELFKYPELALRSWLAYNKAIIEQIKQKPDECVLVSQQAMLSGFPLVSILNEKFDLALNESADLRIDTNKVSNHSSILLPDCPIDLTNELSTTFEELQALSIAPSNLNPKVIWATAFDASSKLSTISSNFKGMAMSMSFEQVLHKITPYWNQLDIPISHSNASDAEQTDSAESNATASYDVSCVDFNNRAAVNQVVAQLNEPAEAQRFLETGIAQLPNNAYLHGLLGKHLFNQNMSKAALQQLNAAVSLSSDDPSVHFHIALLQIQLGRKKEAIHAIQQALVLRRNADHLCLLIRLHNEVLEFKEAQRLSLVGCDWFPADSRFILLHVDALVLDDQLETAIDWCRASNRLSHGIDVANKLYELENSRGNISAAIQYRSEALRRQLKQNANYRQNATNVISQINSGYARASLLNEWCKSYESLLANSPVASISAGTTLPKVAMSILVRDEADIIKQNIQYHASNGVEHFIVTDNASVDGTRELLTSLQHDYSIDIIDEPSHTIDQDLWVTRMAKRLQAMNRFDWIIHNDADEFWVPHNASIPEAVATALCNLPSNGQGVGVLSCNRRNMLPSRIDLAFDHYAFHDNVHAVLNTVPLQEGEQPWSEDNSNCLARYVFDKVLTRAAGLGTVGYGNHDAEHKLDTVKCNTITVHHFPIRTYEQFKKKVVNYGESLAKNTRFGAGSSMHLRYWYDSYLKGQLEQDYLQMTFDHARLESLCATGHLCIDHHVSDFFKSVSLGVSNKPLATAA